MVAITKGSKKDTEMINKSKRTLKSVEEEESEQYEQEEEESEEEEPVLKIHSKVKDPNNGFNKTCANTKEDEQHYNMQKALATDVKSDEAKQSGDFANFDLPKTIVEKLKGKGILYLYPIQVATLKHIRAGHDVIAQASQSLTPFNSTQYRYS